MVTVDILIQVSCDQLAKILEMQWKAAQILTNHPKHFFLPNVFKRSQIAQKSTQSGNTRIHVKGPKPHLIRQQGEFMEGRRRNSWTEEEQADEAKETKLDEESSTIQTERSTEKETEPDNREVGRARAPAERTMMVESEVRTLQSSLLSETRLLFYRVDGNHFSCSLSEMFGFTSQQKICCCSCFSLERHKLMSPFLWL